MKKTLLLFFVATTLVLNSCSKDEDGISVSSEKLTGNWEIYQYKYKGKDKKGIEREETIPFDCSKIDRGRAVNMFKVQFSKNIVKIFDMSIYDNGNTGDYCNESDRVYKEWGQGKYSYELVNNKLVLIPIQGENIEFKITELTNNNLIIEMPRNGRNYSSYKCYKRKN